MSFITESARKISRYFTFSPPFSSLGKCKADCWEDDESDSSLDYDTDSIGSDDEQPAVKSVLCLPMDYKKSQPLAKRIDTSSTNAHRCTDSLLRNGTLRRIEQHIQDELEQQSREERIDIAEPQKKNQVVPGRAKNVSATRHVTFEQTAGTSRPKPKPKPKPKPAVEPSSPKVPTTKDSGHKSGVTMTNEDELEQQSREERIDIAEPQKKKQVATRHVTFAQAAGTSKPKPKPAVEPSSPKVPTNTKDPGHKSDFTMTNAEWSDKPNTRAREVLGKHLHSSAALLNDLKEPEYACRDVEIRDGVWKMMDQIEALAKEHFSFELRDRKSLRAAFQIMPKETVKIIGCVASGGPAGASGWEDLFIDSNKRQALVCAIIGNVLVEQVFQHIFFGGTKEQIKDIAAIQFKHRNDNGRFPLHPAADEDFTPSGFDRNTLYAAKIRSFLSSPSSKGKAPAGTSTLHLPTNFNAHVAHITAALLTHLKPILTLHPRTPAPPSDSLIPSLYRLTTHAGLLSLHMRLDAHTAYHPTPAFKEQPYTASTMECLNHAPMISTHPRGTGDTDRISKEETARRAKLPVEELKRMQHDHGLVQIAMLPGFTAYRRGGWEMLASSSEKVAFEDGCEGNALPGSKNKPW
ncbi:hypothetical protein E8E12_008010 [Didymella heteroderae]|uniref:Uncharacterized protein n=1 Tax=Didymella heteroderae TaxID=1769908 RepID=A0A9P5BZQ3_9PLEO|nr:hypothetical protein E8E12_008010 [Didymella heteroderae]